MLNFNPKSITPSTGDQAILSEVAAVSAQARLFYQRARSELTNNNVRRYFVALEQLHQLPNPLSMASHAKQPADQQLTVVCQWYRRHNTALAADKANWRTELPEQLYRQLAAFKRLSRALTQPENARAMANLTASLQMLTDELNPQLRNSSI